MKSSLRRQVAGAFALLIVVTTVCLHLYVRRAASDAMRRQLRERLAAGCDVVLSAVDELDKAERQARVRQLGADLGARVTVIDRDGAVLADSQADPGRMVRHDTRIEFVEALQRGMAWSERTSATVGVPMMYVAKAAAATGPVVRLALPLEDVHRASSTLSRTMLLTALTATVIAVLAGFWMAGGITRSFDELAAAARRFASGDFSHGVRVPSPREAADVAEALNGMAESLTVLRSQMQESARHLRSVLAQMADGVVVVDARETVQVLNPVAAELLEADPDDAPGKPLGAVVLSYELQAAVRRVLRLRTVVEQEIEITNGQRRHLAVAVSPVEDEEHGLAGAVAAIRDITEIRRLQAIRQDFVVNAGHELRTPVAAIRSLSETLEQGAISDAQVAPGFLTGIIQNTERLENLINDMMELARLEAVEGQEVRQQVDLADLARRVVERLAPQAQQKRLAVNLTAPSQAQVLASEESMNAVLTNLLDNAIKYSPQGGFVEIGLAVGEESVCVTVTDTGPGIPEAERERIFERFYRLDKARSRGLGGTGLGLSIVKHSVEGAGGRVWVEQAPTGGARFVVSLPLNPL